MVVGGERVWTSACACGGGCVPLFFFDHTFPTPPHPKPVDPDAGADAVVAAHAAGINFFDTSPFYGATKSETVLGGGLRRLRRDDYVLATKVGRYGADEFDFSRARVAASVVDSMRRLGVDRLDVVHCHDVEFAADLGAVVTEALPVLADLKRQGVVRAVGVTGYPLPTLQRVLDAAPAGSVDVVLSYCHGCLADRSLAPVAKKWAAAGLGVINASPLSMGLLTARGPPDWHPAPPHLKAACARAAAAAAAAGVDISALALRDSLALDGVASHLVGCGSTAIVAANVDAALAALRPPSEAEAAAAAAVEGVLAPVRGTTWPSGLPQNA